MGVAMPCRSPARTTGRWRFPSLRGLGQRRLLLSNGAVEGLDALLDPARSIPCHRFGLDLEDADRAELVQLLEAR